MIDDNNINLLEETINIIVCSGKSPEDVLFVTCLSNDSTGFKRIGFSWEEFEEVANINYYRSYGGQNVNGSLKIIGSDWWLERHEYDGSEWWEFKTLPKDGYTKMMPAVNDIFEGE